jgi:hypothetical protein
MPTEYIIEFGPNAKTTDISEYSRSIIKKIMAESEVYNIKITSTARDAYDQARVMYENIVAFGVVHQKKLYANAGDQVIDAYSEAKAAGKDKNGIISFMKAKILALGPTKVSTHATEVSRLNVFDVAPSSISEDKKNKWEASIKSNSDIRNYIFPPDDPGYHFEIEQPNQS